MTIQELRDQIDSILGTIPQHANAEVSIQILGHSIGGIPTVGVCNAYFGFDWDEGKFIMVPDTDLLKE